MATKHSSDSSKLKQQLNNKGSKHEIINKVKKSEINRTITQNTTRQTATPATIASINATTTAAKEKLTTAATTKDLIINASTSKTNTSATNKIIKENTIRNVNTKKSEPILNKNFSNGDLKKPVPSKSKIEHKILDKKQTLSSLNKPRPTPMKATKPLTSHSSLNDHQQKRIATKGSVMTQIHNVTISSPPLKRKEISVETIAADSQRTGRDRTRTRTLGPDEVLILKNRADFPDVANIPTKSETKIEAFFGNSIDTDSLNSDNLSTENTIQTQYRIKEPIAFEVNFDDGKVKENNNPQKEKESEKNSDYDYEDDFESYESDFESETNSAESGSEQEISSRNDSGSEATPSPVSPDDFMQKDEERKLDSGNYELRIQRERTHLHSIEEGVVSSDEMRNDSGIGYNTNSNGLGQNEKTIIDSVSDIDIVESILRTKKMVKNENSLEFKINPQSMKKSTRGFELMQKITLDVMTFSLFELKPIPYEYYMKIYGQVNTMQNSTQTQDNVMEQEVQTDNGDVATIWTQYPPHFSKKGLASKSDKLYNEERIGVGVVEDESENDKNFNQFYIDNKLNMMKQSHTVVTQNIDYDRLNLFLQRSAVILSDILDKKSKSKILKKSSIPDSSGFFNLNLKQDFLTEMFIDKIYTNQDIPNLLVTILISGKIHPENDYKNIICVWNILDSATPLKVLSTWNDVSCITVHPKSPDVLIAGFNDGSIGLWDLRESSFWHPSIDGVTFRAPSQLITPNVITESTEKFFEIEYGRVINIKYKSDSLSGDLFNGGYYPIQICSLHEEGIITIWTLLEISNNELYQGKSLMGHLDYLSPWCITKLTQSAFLDLRPFLGYNIHSKNKKIKSNFEKTISYFENDIFNDNALRELQETNNDEKFNQNNNFQCTDFEMNTEGYFIATNKNFIFFCTKSLKRDQFRKIFIDETGNLYPTVLRIFADSEKMIIGLSDGTIKLQLCTPNSGFMKNDGKDCDESPSTSLGVDQQLDNQNFNLKSCTIQNIIKGERKLYEEAQALNNLDILEVRHHNKATVQSGKENKTLNDLLFEKILLGGSYFNREFVRTIHVTKNSERFFALCGPHLKGFDLMKNREIKIIDVENYIKDIGVVTNGNATFSLVIATATEVQIHKLEN